MTTRFTRASLLASLSCLVLVSACTPPEDATETSSEPTAAADGDPGTLALVANGEDFVRQETAAN